jgi:hypothetical protein
MPVCTCWRLTGAARDTHEKRCVYAGMTTLEVAQHRIAKGLEQSAAGETVDLGDFTQYAGTARGSSGADAEQ